MSHKDLQTSRQHHASIEGVAPGERSLAVVRKHPFGIIILYVQAALGLLAVIAITYFILPEYISEETQLRYGSLVALGIVMFIALFALILLLATFIYRQNKLIITDQNVTQILQNGLFNRQVSELSMANVEDVTALKKGFIATVFNFGELRIETAGEQNNFHYTYCPNPSYYGKLVLDARQKFIEGHPEYGRLMGARGTNSTLTN